MYLKDRLYIISAWLLCFRAQKGKTILVRSKEIAFENTQYSNEYGNVQYFFKYAFKRPWSLLQSKIGVNATQLLVQSMLLLCLFYTFFKWSVHYFRICIVYSGLCHVFYVVNQAFVKLLFL